MEVWPLARITPASSPVVPVGAVAVPGRRRVVVTLMERLSVPATEAPALAACCGADATPLAAQRTPTEVAGGRADEVLEVLPAGDAAEGTAGVRVSIVPSGIVKRLSPVGRKAYLGAAGGLHPGGHRVVRV